MPEKKKVVQEHHISYDPEIKQRMYQGEHWLMTNLNRRKFISKGFIRTLKVFIALHDDNAKEIE